MMLENIGTTAMLEQMARAGGLSSDLLQPIL